jgi:hypothetical protein
VKGGGGVCVGGGCFLFLVGRGIYGYRDKEVCTHTRTYALMNGGEEGEDE